MHLNWLWMSLFSDDVAEPESLWQAVFKHLDPVWRPAYVGLQAWDYRECSYHSVRLPGGSLPDWKLPQGLLDFEQAIPMVASPPPVIERYGSDHASQHDRCVGTSEMLKPLHSVRMIYTYDGGTLTIWASTKPIDMPVWEDQLALRNKAKSGMDQGSLA